MAKYNIVETTEVSGRCFDFVEDVDIENGSLVAMGYLVEGERNIYKAKVPAVGDEVFLVANPAWDYDDSRTVNQNEDKFINKAGKPFRVYGLLAINHDKFGVEDYDIAVDDYVTVDSTTTKIKDVSATAPAATNGFVGKVVEIDDYGFSYTTGTATYVWNKIGATIYMTVEEITQMNNQNENFLRKPLEYCQTYYF